MLKLIFKIFGAKYYTKKEREYIWNALVERCWTQTSYSNLLKCTSIYISLRERSSLYDRWIMGNYEAYPFKFYNKEFIETLGATKLIEEGKKLAIDRKREREIHDAKDMKIRAEIIERATNILGES